MSELQEKAIQELGFTVIDAVYDYMRENKERFKDITMKDQTKIVSISLTGATASINKTLTNLLKLEEKS